MIAPLERGFYCVNFRVNFCFKSVEFFIKCWTALQLLRIRKRRNKAVKRENRDFSRLSLWSGWRDLNSVGDWVKQWCGAGFGFGVLKFV